MFERYSFVAITTLDLDRARRFWVGALGFRVTEEKAGHFSSLTRAASGCVLTLPTMTFTGQEC
jgi:catechol 2,3-dioxygenase-like lactoylglutathione lyase family enzyme